jgi:hypothetical protein
MQSDLFASSYAARRHITLFQLANFQAGSAMQEARERLVRRSMVLPSVQAPCNVSVSPWPDNHETLRGFDIAGRSKSLK